MVQSLEHPFTTHILTSVMYLREKSSVEDYIRVLPFRTGNVDRVVCLVCKTVESVIKAFRPCTDKSGEF